MAYTIGSYIKRQKRLQRKTPEEIGRMLRDVGKDGQAKARRLAPRDTGALIHNIKFTVPNNNKQVWITQSNPGLQNKNNQGRAYNYAEAMRPNSSMNTNYSYWKKHVKTGSPDYMREAALFMRKKTKVDVRATVARAVKLSK